MVRKRVTYFPMNRATSTRGPHLAVVLIVSLLSVLLGWTLV